MSAVAEYVMPEADARRLTEKIRLTAHTYTEAREKLIGYVEEAKSGSAHLALGYASWTAYLSDVLGEEPMRLARDERREVVQLLAGEGMSTRMIAPIVGAASHDTVARDLREAGVRNRTPELPTTPEAFEEQYGMRPDEADALISSGMVASREEFDQAAADLANVDMDTGEIHDTPVRRITGADGKTYTRPEPAKPKRRPLPDAFFTTVYDLGKHVERLARLTEDDRFPQNAEKVAAKHRSDLLRARDLLQQVINSLPESERTTP